MQKIILIALSCFILTPSFAQKQRKLNTFLSAQFNKTISDRTLGNNPWGIGLGLQAFLNNKSHFKPTLEFTEDLYLQDDKVLRFDPNSNPNAIGNPIQSVDKMVNLFVGESFHSGHDFYIAFLAGPSFINGQTLFGIKPEFGFYIPGNNKIIGKISYINVFKREITSKQDFSSLSIGIEFKLF